MLFVDGSANSVGIGTSGPTGALYIKQGSDPQITIDGTSTANIVLRSGNGTNQIYFNTAGSSDWRLRCGSGANFELYDYGRAATIWTCIPNGAVEFAAPVKFTGVGLSYGIWFGDGDSGFYESGDDTLRWRVGGNNIFLCDTARMRGDATGSPALLSGTGTAADPAYAFNDDYDTGIYRSGTNHIAITTAGSERFNISATGRAQFTNLYAKVVDTTTAVMGVSGSWNNVYDFGSQPSGLYKVQCALQGIGVYTSVIYMHKENGNYFEVGINMDASTLSNLRISGTFVQFQQNSGATQSTTGYQQTSKVIEY